jgi:hypothetical protein
MFLQPLPTDIYSLSTTGSRVMGVVARSATQLGADLQSHLVVIQYALHAQMTLNSRVSTSNAPRFRQFHRDAGAQLLAPISCAGGRVPLSAENKALMLRSPRPPPRLHRSHISSLRVGGVPLPAVGSRARRCA